MLCNSAGDVSCAAMTSRLSSCSCGSSTSRSSKICTRSGRPSQMPHVNPAGSSSDALSPISSVSSRRAAVSGISPRLTPPSGKCPRRADTRSAQATMLGRHRPPLLRPHVADVSAATRCRPGKARRKAVRQARSRNEVIGVCLRPDVASAKFTVQFSERPCCRRQMHCSDDIRSGHRAQEEPLQHIRERGPERLGKVSICAEGRRRSSLPRPILSPNALALRERQHLHYSWEISS